MLSGHRDRFYPMFRRLQKFFIDAGALTYVTALISVPKLPNVCTDRQVEFRNRQINRQTCQLCVGNRDQLRKMQLQGLLAGNLKFTTQNSDFHLLTTSVNVKYYYK